MWGYVNFTRDIFRVERCADRGKMKEFVQNSIIKTHKYVNGWYKGNQGPLNPEFLRIQIECRPEKTGRHPKKGRYGMSFAGAGDTHTAHPFSIKTSINLFPMGKSSSFLIFCMEQMNIPPGAMHRLIKFIQLN